MRWAWVVAAATVLAASARDVTTRRNLRPDPSLFAREDSLLVADPTPQVRMLEPGDVEVFGYGKPRAAVRESFFVRNNLPDTLSALTLRITYLRPDGILLHTREVVLSQPLNPFDTRHFEIPAWDKLKTYYYIGTPPSRRASGGRPYKVTITPESVSR